MEKVSLSLHYSLKRESWFYRRKQSWTLLGLQSLRLSIANEQNLCNLAHWVDYQSLPHLAAGGKAGLPEYSKLFELASWRYRVTRSTHA